jgi:phosphoserine phosphatase
LRPAKKQLFSAVTDHSNQVVLINVSGRDRPGITSGLVSVLNNYPVHILDIDQAVIHNRLSWGMLIDVNPEGTSPSPSDALFRDMLFTAHDMDLDIRFTPISEDEYDEWIAGSGHDKHIITLLGRRLGADILAQVTQLVSGQNWNIASIQRVSPRGGAGSAGTIGENTDSHSTRALSAVELRIHRKSGEIDDLRAACLSLSAKIDADIAIQEDNIWRRNRRLVCFDMDSTLIQREVIDLMAEAAGVGDRVSAITASAMNGEIDFSESFAQRLGLLKGLPESALEQIDQQIEITDGAESLLRNLRRLGYTTAIISGGFTWFAERLAERLGIDHVHANELEIVDGQLSGRVTGDIVNESKKAELLRSIAKNEGVRLEQVIAVGDGANDIPMLTAAGLGIAFHAKSTVRENANTAFGTVGLDGILYLIGMRESEIEHETGNAV